MDYGRWIAKEHVFLSIFRIETSVAINSGIIGYKGIFPPEEGQLRPCYWDLLPRL
jgi:hypothetical protein